MVVHRSFDENAYHSFLPPLASLVGKGAGRMKEIEKRRPSKTKQTLSAGRTERRENKSRQDTKSRKVNGKQVEAKTPHARPPTNILRSQSNTVSETSEVYEDLVIHDIDKRSEEEPSNNIVNRTASSDNTVVHEQCADLEKEQKQGSEELSDCETIKDSVSAQCESFTVEDEKIESSRDLRSDTKISSLDNCGARESNNEKATKLQPMASNGDQNKTLNSHKGPSRVEKSNTSMENSKLESVPPKPSSEFSDRVEKEVTEDFKESEYLDAISNGAQSVGSDDETRDSDGEYDGESELKGRIEEMEMRVEKLEEELREVAALEISLYSIVPEHGSSAHKVHTPARRLSRLFIHAFKYQTQDKRATIAKNTVSGLVVVAKSCGSDVPRLSFWLSNTIALRMIISQALGSCCQATPLTRFSEPNDVGNGKPSSLKWKGSPATKLVNGVMQHIEDWQESATFTSALEKAESWMFSRIVESVWWQALTPYMQSQVHDMSPKRTLGKLLGSSLGDQQQGCFSINLWKNAFQDASQRICPVRAGGHECGCLPVLARLVMEQCIARLDVAMFNAILRESANEIPTDPVSDPIVDSKVLPILAGDLSFGSGAQLKNSVGNWSRWLTDMFGMDADEAMPEDDDRLGGSVKPKTFILLNALSDLLMLPKDILMNQQVREEVCPSISLPLIIRILCNFTPDEFCPDPVSGTVLEAINAECIADRRFRVESARIFPYTAAPVTYSPPSIDEVAEKIAEASEKSQLARNPSAVQRKGYTSDEELEELDSPLVSIIDKLPTSPSVMNNGRIEQTNHTYTNLRYKLLHEVWFPCEC